MIIISDELESRFGEGNEARQSSISYEGNSDKENSKEV